MHRKSNSPTGLRVACTQDSCVHFHPDPHRQKGMCLCKHPEKSHYLNQYPCPLFRMSWSKSDLMDMF